MATWCYWSPSTCLRRRRRRRWWRSTCRASPTPGSPVDDWRRWMTSQPTGRSRVPWVDRATTSTSTTTAATSSHAAMSLRLRPSHWLLKGRLRKKKIGGFRVRVLAELWFDKTVSGLNAGSGQKLRVLKNLVKDKQAYRQKCPTGNHLGKLYSQQPI